MVECVWLPVARNCNETWGGSDEIKWEMSDKMKDDSDETKDNSNKMRETHNSNKMRETHNSKEREVIVKQNLLATTPNSSWDSDLG